MKQYLLCTDLDRTLIPNGIQPESARAMETFKHLVQREDILLAYVSGRHKTLILDAIKEYKLPQPDFAIADVGTTIYQIDTAGWHMWPAWDAEIAPDWRGLSHDDVSLLLGNIPVMRIQEKEKQNRYKLSFYVPQNTNQELLLSEIGRILKYERIMANLIWSIDEEAHVGLLDILPASANKLHAIRFLMAQKNFPIDRTIFAGDSGNDLDVLLSDIPSVLVANASADVKTQARRAPRDTCYLAQGGFLEMNGNYSAGILEGVAHYWPDIDL